MMKIFEEKLTCHFKIDIEGVAGKEGDDFFQGGGGRLQFYIKNKLKPGKFNEKISKNIFLCHN